MYKFNFSLLVVFLSCLTLSCGGSSTQESNESNDSDYSIFPSDYFSVGFNESYNLTGSDSEGRTYSGRYSVQTQAEDLFDGIPSVAVVQTLDFTIEQTGASSSSIGTDYYSTGDSAVELLGFTASNISTVSADPVAIPVMAKIGEFGAIGSYLDNVGNTRTASWRLENSANGNANLISVLTTIDQAGTIVETSETSQIIDSTGNRSSVELRLNFLSAGLALVFTGVKN